MQAKKLTTDPEEVILAIIALVVLIDGKPVLFEDLKEMDGFDVLSLMTEFSGFIQAPAN